ncbi:MAG: alpha-ketoglutarate-dependent dioxygenase AlkB [Deltaproteobacteria bacterium]|nr:alpha-ketoglutarate-dependent dioxygenase AlkB [Deltaproteobacteria bacterium]
MPRGLQRVRARADARAHLYDPKFVTPSDRAEIVAWLQSIFPLWEQRYSAHHPPPKGQPQRALLRPVYWLGNWQFACLDYYRPPKGIWNRCVKAEPFPPVLARLVAEIERRARTRFRGEDLPDGWHLNTCLVNLYGSRVEGEKRIDTARVGEHKDFEPGPVASVSLGERALFQFVSSKRPGERDAVALQQWLDDGSLQVFGGARFKDQLFHRVQRVDHRTGSVFALNVADFETRRVNFTFRYVPDAHVIPYAKLPADDAEDVRGYMEQLAKHSAFFARELAARTESAKP